ncbi:hypothetical protein lerEdw1_012885, partial [Lerista edwardsae]
VIALADAAEENQANRFQAFTKLKSATQLVILLISLWQKLNADQVAILEATFLPLAQDTQELDFGQNNLLLQKPSSVGLRRLLVDLSMDVLQHGLAV